MEGQRWDRTPERSYRSPKRHRQSLRQRLGPPRSRTHRSAPHAPDPRPTKVCPHCRSDVVVWLSQCAASITNAIRTAASMAGEARNQRMPDEVAILRPNEQGRPCRRAGRTRAILPIRRRASGRPRHSRRTLARIQGAFHRGVPATADPLLARLVARRADPAAVMRATVELPDPFQLFELGSERMRARLSALPRSILLEIVTAFELNPAGKSLAWLSDRQLVTFIVTATEVQLRQGR